MCFCKIGKEKRRRWQRKEEEEEENLLGSRRKVSPVWVCFSRLLFYANILFKGSIIHSWPVTSLAFKSEHQCSLIFCQLVGKFWANHLFSVSMQNNREQRCWNIAVVHTEKKLVYLQLQGASSTDSSTAKKNLSTDKSWILSHCVIWGECETRTYRVINTKHTETGWANSVV